MAELYAELSNVAEFNDIFKKARQNATIIEMLDIFQLSGEERLEENDIIFKLLFKYEYFDLLHRCIVDYFANNKNTLSSKYITNLLNSL